MVVYFSRAGGGQHNCSPVLQVVSAHGTDVTSTNSGGDADWKDIATVNVHRITDTVRFNIAINCKCQATKSTNAYGAPEIRLAIDNGSGDANNAQDVYRFGEGLQASDEYDTTSFTYYYNHGFDGVSFARYRLQLKCNRYGTDTSTPVSATASGSLEVIVAEKLS